jgi:hypothetical protein
VQHYVTCAGGNNAGPQNLARGNNMANKCTASAANNYLGKYAAQVAKAGGNPYQVSAYAFNLGAHAFAINNGKGAMVPKPATVFGVICSMVAAKPGITGVQLLHAMQAHNWASFAGKIGYVSPAGKVCVPWCMGYLQGMVATVAHTHLPLTVSMPVALTTKANKA